MTKFTSHRIGLAGKHHRRDDCSTGGLYKSPTRGATVDATQPVNVAWDASCFSADKLNIYLYGYGAGGSLLQTWVGIPTSDGSHSVHLNPAWWNNNSTASLQFTVAPSDTLLFMIDTPAGPVFTATYSGTSTSAPSQNTAPVGAVEQVAHQSSASEGHGPSKGGIAAAVLVPLLLLIGLAVAAYIRIARQKGKEKRKRFSEMIDKRMSTISTDWKSLSGAGANAAIRSSIAVSGNRASSFSFGAIRPSSTVAEDGGHAGIGAAGIVPDAPPMSQLRPGLRTSAFENRTSRVSFAADTRPSSEYRRTRAFHTGHVPPLPDRQPSTENSSNASPIMSPIQTAGPLSLTPDDIRSRMSGQETRPSMDEVMPALSMMRTGAGELLFDSQIPTPPTPTHQTTHTPKSPVMGVMPMQPMPASVMSPDDMLRAYAERRAMGGASAPNTPAPAANYNGNGMRVLYSPDAGAPASPDSVYPVSRKSLAPTEYSKYDEEDAYGGTAQ